VAIGITVFAAAMLLLLGGSQFFLGLAGVINDEVFAKVGGYVFRFDATVWGWIHMILGVVFILVGWFVLRGAAWAIWTAIGLAVLNGVLNFSILDGWWIEGYNGENGFSIGDFSEDDSEAGDGVRAGAQHADAVAPAMNCRRSMGFSRPRT